MMTRTIRTIRVGLIDASSTQRSPAAGTEYKPAGSGSISLLSDVAGGCAGQVGHWIDREVVEPHLEVEVRAGRVTRRTHEADEITLPDLLAHLDGVALEVAVQGHQPVLVGDDEVSAISDQGAVRELAVLCRHYHAVIGGKDWRSGVVGDVDPGMEMGRTEHGRLTPERAGAEGLADHTRLRRPYESRFGGVAGRRGENDAVAPHPGLGGGPGGLVGLVDERVLASDLSCRDLRHQVGVLCVGVVALALDVLN